MIRLETTSHLHYHLLHGGEVKPDVGEEGESELHTRVEEEIDEVGQPHHLQVLVLLGVQVSKAGKPEQLCRVKVAVCLG